VVAGDDQVLDEAALFLAEQGRTVDRVQMGREPRWKLDPANRVLTRRLLESGVTLHTVERVEEISGAGLSASSADHGSALFPGDAFVLWPGLEPVSGLVEEFESRGVTTKAIGDCVRPRKILDAVHEAHVAARSL
jgi:hypothetical protein